ncbi:Structural maintenance of chromosomes protein, partial [Globisporangium splendens]
MAVTREDEADAPASPVRVHDEHESGAAAEEARGPSTPVHPPSSPVAPATPAAAAVPSSPVAPATPVPPAAPKTRLMITKMQLENFKSYAGKVEIGPFHQCFSAVVGPNGSGKSNVIDALLFVFGKRASKLRLKKVSELVHRSASFPDLETATVSVFFHEIYDESEDGKEEEVRDAEARARATVNGHLESYRVVPNSEFVVTRSATKSNVSKYFVNDRPSNFTQVTELLSGKGIDLDNNRFLILQGEVEQIAMMKSKAPEGSSEDGLLEYLEDIIGSNVYVEPTEKVWQEVEDCNEKRAEKVNRVKLVEKEKAHLEGPRQEAMEYLRKEKEVYAKTNILYQLWIQDASSNRSACETRKQELQAQYEAELEKMEANRKELESVEVVYQKVKEEHDVVAVELDATKSIYADFEKEDVKLREELKFGKEQLKEMEQTKKKELKKQKSILQKQEENEELVPQLEKEVEKLQEKLKKQEQVIETILEEHKTETEKLRSTMETLQNEMEPFQAQMNELRSVIDTTETEIQLVEEPVTNAKKALEANVNAIEDAEATIEDIEHQQEQKRGDLENMKKRIIIAEKELAHAKEQDGVVSEKYREARSKAEEASGAVQSQATRSRMLRALLDASKPGQPLANAGLFGRLGDLGAIDAKYDVAISTACSALDNLVVATTSGAQACVEFLRKNNLGRTTFLILEQLGYLHSKCSQQFRPITGPSGQQAPRLFDLVQVSDQKFLPSFYFALRDTLVAKDLDEATAIAYQGNQCKYRVVTLDGQLVELSGAMSGGGKRTKSGGMSSSIASSGLSEGEISALQKDAADLKAELERVRNEKFALEKEVSKLTRDIEQYENELPRLELNLGATKTKLTDLRETKKSLEKQTTLSADAKKQVAKLKKTKSAKEVEFEDIKKKVQGMESKLAELKEKILDVGGAKLRKEQDVAKRITKQIDEKTKQMTKIRVDFKSSQKNSEKNIQALAQLEEDMEALKKKIEDIRGQITAMEEKAMEVVQKVETIEKEVKKKEESLRKEEKKYHKLKKQYDEMRSGEVDLQNSLEDCEKMLEENTKKEAYWSSKLTTLHDAYIVEQEQNAGVFDDEPRAPRKEREEKKKKKKKAPGKPVAADPDNEDVEMEDVEEESKEAETDEAAMEEDAEEENDDEEEQEEEDYIHMDKLPILDEKALASYNKEEMKYEISVIEQQRDELKANVNMGALMEYKEKEIEYRARLQELEDATKLRDEKRHEYDELRRKRLEEFMTGFRIITLKLKEMYQMITLGGDAELELVDSLDPFSEGVVFSVRPSKKSWKNISNLSGGEKTLASLALVFALHHYKPTPLYVMDEIDAALDFKNVSIVGNYIKQRTRNAQFVIISLRNNMFELADRLVGIYKTNDATKSVTINPKVYESMLPSRPPMKTTDDLRTPKKSRRSEPSTPASVLRDRTNQSAAACALAVVLCGPSVTHAHDAPAGVHVGVPRVAVVRAPTPPSSPVRVVSSPPPVSCNAPIKREVEVIDVSDGSDALPAVRTQASRPSPVTSGAVGNASTATSITASLPTLETTAMTAMVEMATTTATTTTTSASGTSATTPTATRAATRSAESSSSRKRITLHVKTPGGETHDGRHVQALHYARHGHCSKRAAPRVLSSRASRLEQHP